MNSDTLSARPRTEGLAPRARAKALTWKNDNMFVSNSQGRNLGCSVTSARTSVLSSRQGMILGESG